MSELRYLNGWLLVGKTFDWAIGSELLNDRVRIHAFHLSLKAW
jgi:hypothetical protein